MILFTSQLLLSRAPWRKDTLVFLKVAAFAAWFSLDNDFAATSSYRSRAPRITALPLRPMHRPAYSILSSTDPAEPAAVLER